MPFWIPLAVLVAGGIGAIAASSNSSSGSSGYSRSRSSSDESDSCAKAIECEKNERRCCARADLEEYFNDNLMRMLRESGVSSGEPSRIPKYGFEDIKDIVLINSEKFSEIINSCFADGCKGILAAAEEMENEVAVVRDLAAELSRRGAENESPEGLIKQVRKYLEKFVGDSRADELINAAVGVFRLVARNRSPFIVNTGLLKAGKSSLYNALFDSDEKFRTGSVRATLDNQSEMLGGTVYIDTPGIDALEADEKKARHALMKADLTLYVFNLDCGGLEDKEIEYLKSIFGSCGNPAAAINGLIFTGTCLDKVEGRHEAIVDQVRRQIAENFGAAPEIICVSSKRYLKGAINGKASMVEKSGIMELRVLIDSVLKARCGDLRLVRARKYAAAMHAVVKELEAAVSSTEKELALIINTVLSKSKGLKEQIGTLLESARAKMDFYDSI